MLPHGLGLIGRLALEHRAGGEIAAHLAALHVEPIDDLGLGELDDLPKLHLLGRARRIVDAPGVFVAARPELRQPEVFVAVTVGDRDLDRQLGRGRSRGTGERQELGQGSFARVFLAEQADLAGRPVVLKISSIQGDEPQTLA